MPDIMRLFKGPGNEFEVEVVFAGTEDMSPREAHSYLEYIVVAHGSIQLERDDTPGVHTFAAPSFIELPAGVEHVIDIQEDGTKLVIIHPARTD